MTELHFRDVTDIAKFGKHFSNLYKICTNTYSPYQSILHCSVLCELNSQVNVDKNEMLLSTRLKCMFYTKLLIYVWWSWCINS